MNQAIHEECLKRLEILQNQGMASDIDIIGLFSKGQLCICEDMTILNKRGGLMFPLEGRPSYGTLLKKAVFPRLKATPYMILAGHSGEYRIATVLCVSDKPHNWEKERKLLAKKAAPACVFNVDLCAIDATLIRYEIMNGGPVRIA